MKVFYKFTLMAFIASCTYLSAASTTGQNQPLAEKNSTPIYYASNIEVRGQSIELHNGAIWKVDASSVDTVAQWQKNDPIVIYPSSLECYSRHKFYLYNQRTDDYAYANLSMGPFADHIANYRIYNVNIGSETVFTTNHRNTKMEWLIDPADKETIKKWKIDQSILIASNNTFLSGLSSNSPYILINIERDESVRADLKEL